MEAAIKKVTAELPEIAKLAADDPAGADVKCMTMIEDTEALLASTDANARKVGEQADRLCNYTVPLRTLEVVKDCKSQDASTALMNLAFHKKLDIPAVADALSKWNAACPDNKLEVPK